MNSYKEPIVWLSVHAILFLIIVFFPTVFACGYCILAGTALLVSGAIIWLISFKEMKGVKVQITADKLVTSGIYSKIKHPLYFGVRLMFIGFALIFKSLLGLILIIIILVPLHLYRARKEEKELTNKFGDKYLEYKKRTWF